MNNNLIFVDISVILFSCVYGIVSIFLIFQVKKMEKIARPFIISLFIYFMLDLIGNISEYIKFYYDFDLSVLSDYYFPTFGI